MGPAAPHDSLLVFATCKSGSRLPLFLFSVTSSFDCFDEHRFEAHCIFLKRDIHWPPSPASDPHPSLSGCWYKGTLRNVPSGAVTQIAVSCVAKFLRIFRELRQRDGYSHHSHAAFASEPSLCFFWPCLFCHRGSAIATRRGKTQDDEKDQTEEKGRQTKTAWVPHETGSLFLFFLFLSIPSDATKDKNKRKKLRTQQSSERVRVLHHQRNASRLSRWDAESERRPVAKKRQCKYRQ